MIILFFKQKTSCGRRIREWSSDVCTSDLPLGRFGKAAQPRLEQRQPFGEAEAVGQRLANLEVDAARPHAGVGALLGRRTDQRGLRVFLVEIFADRGDFRENAAVVELERGRLSGGVHIRSEEHTSELQSLMRISYAVFC